MEVLNEKQLSKYLKGQDLKFFDTVDSTFNISGDSIVIAAAQTQGTGRLNRPFFCNEGGIYLTIKTPLKPLLTISAAAGALKALQKIGINAQVKWVNDILINGKKAMGILVKSNGQIASVGLGANYFQQLPQELNSIATNIKASTKGINKFAAILIKSLQEAFATPTQENLEFYKTRLFGLNGQITLPNGEQAIFKRVTNEGNLVYLKEDKEGILYYGDIHS